MQHIIIDNRVCNLFIKGEKGPVFLHINEPSIPVGALQITEALEQIDNSYEYIFVEILINDWDKNLSPWSVKTNNRVFDGNAPLTLNWLLNNVIPYLKNNFTGHEEFYLAGYSLSGLFALWSLYNTDIFNGIICCSGSLWFPKWDEFMQNNHLRKNSMVYLSLGGKEEKTKNPLMASVGINTRKQLSLLKNDILLKSATLEMNPGGHFADTAFRVAKGIRWILKEKEFCLLSKKQKNNKIKEQ